MGYNVGKILYFFLRSFFSVRANSADLDEMPHYTAFHLGLHCLLKTHFAVTNTC